MSQHPLLARRLGLTPNPVSESVTPNPEPTIREPFAPSRDTRLDPHGVFCEPPEPRNTIRDSETRLKLDRYPDYEFLEDGTPIMIRQPKRGIRVKLGPCEPLYVTKFQPTYNLRRADGKREQKTLRQIKAMLAGGSAPVEYYTLDAFPFHRFTANGTAYSIARNRECRHTDAVDRYGFPVRRYVLHDKDRTTRAITDHQIRRILFGKASDSGVEIPDDWKVLSGEFVDYAYAPAEQALYRISSRRRKLYEPRLMKPTPAGQYVVFNFEGQRRMLTLKTILELGNVEQPVLEP